MNQTLKFAAAALAILITFPAFSQDIITKTNGDELQGKVIKITKINVKYKMEGNGDSSVHSIAKKSVFSIKYENGLKEVFNESHIDDADMEGHWDKKSMKQQGKEDAMDNYHKYRGAKAGTEITAFVGGPIIGLIPAIICSSTPPKEKNLNYPDPELMKNEEYNAGYRAETRHLKRKKVWGGYVAGVVIEIASIVLEVMLVAIM